jgi:hypothetical protein
MALKLVAYRLKNDASYPVRYGSLIAALDKLTQTKWSEETSLVLLLFNGTAEALHAHLLANSRLYRNSDDMLVVMDITVNEKETLGLKKAGLLDAVLGFAQTPKASRQSAVVAALLSRGSNTLGSR